MIDNYSQVRTRFAVRRGEGVEARKRRNILSFLFAAMLLLIIILQIVAPPISTWMQRALASLIIIIGALPTFLYFLRRETGIPYMPLWGAIYAVYYGLPIFLLDDYSFKGYGTESGITESLWVALVGECLLLTAFYCAPRRMDKLLPRVNIELEPTRAKAAAVVLGLVGLAATYLMELGIGLESFNAVFVFVTQWALLSIAILYILSLKGQLNTLLKIFLWLIMLPILLLIQLGGGSIATLVQTALVPIFIYWVVRRRIPVKAIIICVIVLVPLLGLKAEFRQTAWSAEQANVSVIQKGVNFINLITERFSGDYKQTYSASVDTTASRAAQLQTLDVVVEATPGAVPYWYGESYVTIFTTFIPRFLWPDKPSKNLGQAFGHRYSFIGDDDTWTSWNFPQLAEMYANFGWWGIIFGMPLLGLIYRLIYGALNHPNAGDGGKVIAAIIFVGLANIESDFSLVFGAVLQTTLLFVFMLRFMSKARRQFAILPSNNPQFTARLTSYR